MLPTNTTREGGLVDILTAVLYAWARCSEVAVWVDESKPGGQSEPGCSPKEIEPIRAARAADSGLLAPSQAPNANGRSYLVVSNLLSPSMSSW